MNSDVHPHAAFRPRVAGCILVMVTLLVYIPALLSGFLWDDDIYITNNPHVCSVAGLSALWVPGKTMDYYPVFYSCLWLQFRLWGGWATGYHLVNVLLHAGNALLVWRLLSGLRVRGAWYAALLFAVHPLNVEAVAWISQQKTTLSLLLCLLAALAYLRWLALRTCAWYAVSLACYLGALLSKPAVVMFPVVMLGYHLWRDRRIALRRVAEVAPFFAVSAVVSAVTVWFQRHHAIEEVVVGPGGLPERMALAGRAALFYLQKVMLPVNLSPVYPQWDFSRLTALSAVPGCAVALILILLALRCRRHGCDLLFGLLFFLVMLFPVLGFFDIGFMFYSFVADHWAYVGLVGLLGGLVAAGLRATDAQSGLSARTPLLGALLVGILAVLSFCQTLVYRDMESYFRYTLTKNPDAWVAHNNLGNACLERREMEAAEWHYRRALDVYPDYWEALNGLGIILAGHRDFDPAIACFRRALDAKPNFGKAAYNLRVAEANREKAPPPIGPPRLSR